MKTRSYRERASARRISWTLTLDQYVALQAAGACTYCGGALPTNGSGLDRIDNHRGYEVGNVVPSCRWLSSSGI